MRTLFFLLSALLFPFVKAQVCDSIYPEDPAQLEKTAEKFREKLLKNKSVTSDAALCFEIAQHLRRKGDTLAGRMYYYAADLFKKDYSKEKKADAKAEILYKLGLCYFYCNDPRMAETYFSKAIKAKYPSPCNYYYLYLCKKSLGKNDEAEIELQQFKLQTGN